MKLEEPSAELTTEFEWPLRWLVFLVVACLCHAAVTLLSSGFAHQSGGDWQ